MSLYVEKSNGTVGPPGADKKINWRLEKCATGQSQPTPDEIAQAKEDGVCPRCDSLLDIGNRAFLCHECGWSF